MKKLIRLVIIAVIIAALITSYFIYKKKQGKPEWRLDRISTGNLREEVTASGTLNPSSQVNVGTEISGKISKIYKDFNSTVKKGDLLAKLDTENLETSLESAQSDVRKAQITVEDTKIDLDLQTELLKNNISTAYDLQKAQNKYDQAVQSLANARFALKRAEKNLKNAIITSPIDGVIVSRNVDEGQTVAASLNAPTLFVIANNLKKMQINADIDEADIGKISVGLPVEFRVDAFADDNFEGKVNQVRLSPSTEQNVVTYSVIIDVDNSQLKLLPGMTANVTIIIREKDNVLTIPETAIRFKPSKELWKQFGLKWDDKLLASIRSKGRGQWKPNASAQAVSTGTKPDSLKSKPVKTAAGLKDASRIVKDKTAERPDISKMTPEQKAVYRDKVKKKSSQNNTEQAAETTGGQFNFSASNTTREKTSRNRIWVLVNGKPEMKDIVTGLSDGNKVELISGLDKGQEFITGVNYKNAKQAAAASTSILGNSGGFRPGH